MKADRRDYRYLSEAVKRAHKRASGGVYAPLVVEDLAEELIALLERANSSFCPDRFRKDAGLLPRNPEAK